MNIALSHPPQSLASAVRSVQQFLRLHKLGRPSRQEGVFLVPTQSKGLVCALEAEVRTQNRVSSIRKIFLGARPCTPHRKSSRAREDERGNPDLINSCMDSHHETWCRSGNCTCTSKEKKLRQNGLFYLLSIRSTEVVCLPWANQ